jgi:branched-subunit amino acid ABC-type transport system permease component
VQENLTARQNRTRVDLTFLSLQFLNGMAFAITLIFGLMDVLNLAHGTFYLVGAYVGLTILKVTGNFWVALVVAPITVAALGYVVEVLVIRPVYARGHLDQVLLTLGLAYILADQARGIWGSGEEALAAPALLARSVSAAGMFFPLYRLFVIGFGLAAAAVLWIIIERTRWGAVIRAGVTNPTMVRNLGIDIGRVFAHTFAFGCGLAALAGVVAGPIVGVAPGLDAEILMLALIVVVTGGLGSLSGSFWGSILIGQADTFGKALLPQFSLFFIFVVMALVLLYRPGGLLGKRAL